MTTPPELQSVEQRSYWQATAPAMASRRFPLVPAPYEGRAWFLPLAGEYWTAKDRLAARQARRAG